MSVARTAAEAIKCPAGQPIEGVAPDFAGCRCQILHETITLAGNGSTLRAFCSATPGTPAVAASGERTDYTDCPAWRRMREAEMENADRALAGAIARSV